MYVEDTPTIAKFPNGSVPSRGRALRTAGARSLPTFLMVFGLGLIVIKADNGTGALWLQRW